MRPHARPALLAGLLVTALAAVPLAPAQAAKVGAPLFGAHVQSLETGSWLPGPGRVSAVRLWDSGAAWGQVNPAPGVFDFTALDAAVATARANGAQVLYVLGSTPTWASSNPTLPAYLNPGSSAPPTTTQAWTDWVTAVATRYRGQISAYQIWNEANLTTFWTGSPTQMADLTKAAHDAIAAVDPAATVVAASTTTRLGGAYRDFFPPYLKQLKKRGWPVDVFSGHFYPPGNGTPKTRAGYIETFMSDLSKAKAPKRPVWETEVNYGLAGPGTIPHVDITGSTAQAYLAQTFLDSQRLGVARSYWYLWTADDNPLLGVQLDAAEPTAAAWSTVRGWLVGQKWRGCTTSKKTVTCRLGTGSKKATIVWTQQGSTKVAAPKGATQACALDSCSRTKAGKKVRVGLVPVRFNA